jgi:hypothetical protein
MLQLPLATHFLFFMNFPIFPIKKIKKNIFFFSKNVKLGRLEGMIFLSMCAKYLVQSPSISSKNALVCAMACPWAAHGKPWPAPSCLGVCHGQAMGCQGKPLCVPWPPHGLPRLAMGCLGVCHGQPWAAMTCLGVCHGKPWAAHGMPWCVPRQVMRVPN